MADITICMGTDCPIKEKCKRFTAKINPQYQSVFLEIPGKWDWVRDDLDNIRSDRRVFTCEMYWGEGQDQIMDYLVDVMK